MVVIKGEAWPQEETNEQGSEKGSPSQKSGQLYGLNDLASDYFQALNDQSRPKFCKIIWILIVIAMFILTLYMSISLIMSYYEYSSFDEGSTDWKDKVILPAITICSTNYINYTAMKEEMSADNDTQQLLSDFQDFMRVYTTYNSKGNFINYIDISATKSLVDWEKDEGSISNRFKNGKSSMLIGESDYTFQKIGRILDKPNKFIYATELGMCVELNDNGGLVQTYSGKDGGLTMDIDANVADYLLTTETKGFVLFVRDQDETVMLNQGGYIIAPGTETFVKLTSKSVTRLGKPHGTCEDVESYFSKYSSTFETVRECIQRQKVYAMIEHCSCIPWYFADRLYNLGKTGLLDEVVEILEQYQEEAEGDSSRKRRGLDEADITELLHRAEKRSEEEVDKEPRVRPPRQAENRPPRQAENMTTPSDDSISTSWVSSEPQWTSPQPISETDYSPNVCGFVYQQACNKILERKIRKGEVQLKSCPEPCAYREWNVEMASTVFPSTEEYFEEFLQYQVVKDTTPTFEYARENMARIHIYYDNIKVVNIDQVPSYDIASFIGEFGGTVDLFIGFSFFTIFQLFEILIAGILFKLFKCFGGKPGNKSDKKATVVENDVALNDVNSV